MKTKITSVYTDIKENYRAVSRYVGAAFSAPSMGQAQALLFVVGLGILTAGLSEGANAIASAQNLGNYNDLRFAEATNRIFGYLEGSFGALIMVASGLGAILSAAFGQYRAALALLVVAVGSFILRSMVSTFFNDQNIG